MSFDATMHKFLSTCPESKSRINAKLRRVPQNIINVVYTTVKQDTKYYGSLASRACSMDVRMVDRVSIEFKKWGAIYIRNI